ncbi:hypothetical protein [Azohydromonas lata]|uniref:hypothetical protein n=1 Tax=Azohydromonas lata TaxID=45677 RepID=UPI0009FBEBFC|nr:hypothetical protein [Azohydromonas lata]
MATLERNLLLTSLLLAFFIASPDFYYLQTGGFSTGLEVGPLSYLKVLKDVFYLLIFCLLLARHTARTVVVFFIAALLVLVPVLYTIFSVGTLKVLFGFRWYFPAVLAVAVAYSVPRQDFTRKGARYLLAVMCVNVAAQLIQRFLFPPLFFMGEDDMLSRAPGIFFLPSASSILMTACTLYISRAHADGQVSGAFRTLAFLLLTTTISLSDSATAMIIFAVLLASEFKLIKVNMLGLVITISISLLALYVAVLFSPRGQDIVDRSLFNRLQLFESGASESGIISSDFGGTTSAGIMLGGAGYRSLESTFGAVFGNLGALPGIVLLAILMSLLIAATFRNKRSSRALPALVLVLGALVSVNAFEFFPMGAMMLLLVRRI